jgi:hypothetical protein
MVPQAWFVLAIFVLSISFTVAMTIISPFYRMLMFDSRGVHVAFHILLMLITAILLVFSAQCSIAGSTEMSSCFAFTWVLVVILTIALLAQIGYGIYVHIALKRNEKSQV